MARKSELQVAVERLDVKISSLEMVMNSSVVHGAWPKRNEWRTLIRLAQNVVDEYGKESNE